MTQPTVVTICGSSRFKDEHLAMSTRETLLGHIVLGMGFFHHEDNVPITAAVKEKLDILQGQKIDMSDEILVVNPNGYIGESTKKAIIHAIANNKGMRFTDKDAGEEYLQANTHEIGRLVAETVTQ